MSEIPWDQYSGFGEMEREQQKEEATEAERRAARYAYRKKLKKRLVELEARAEAQAIAQEAEAMIAAQEQAQQPASEYRDNDDMEYDSDVGSDTVASTQAEPSATDAPEISEEWVVFSREGSNIVPSTSLSDRVAALTIDDQWTVLSTSIADEVNGLRSNHNLPPGGSYATVSSTQEARQAQRWAIAAEKASRAEKDEDEDEDENNNKGKGKAPVTPFKEATVPPGVFNGGSEYATPPTHPSTPIDQAGEEFKTPIHRFERKDYPCIVSSDYSRTCLNRYARARQISPPPPPRPHAHPRQPARVDPYSRPGGGTAHASTSTCPAPAPTPASAPTPAPAPAPPHHNILSQLGPQRTRPVPVADDAWREFLSSPEREPVLVFDPSIWAPSDPDSFRPPGLNAGVLHMRLSGRGARERLEETRPRAQGQGSGNQERRRATFGSPIFRHR
ncbi:hypothetical protein F4781DRAFT_441641 [Annulohypoxylon bovei var. microspora]|nr:hypothetical protein F4781DRAFT_441641 [Annulohypoxylon bovei var. microspora]